MDAAATALGAPASETVAIGEVIAGVREGLLAMVGTGLQVMAAMMNEDVSAVCWPKGKHEANRTATRHGSEYGSVTLGGRRVPVVCPRMRAADGSGELPLPGYGLFSGTEAHHRDHRAAGRAARAWPGHQQAHPGRDRRGQDAQGRRDSRVRSPGDRSVSTAQDPH
jgi:hypothetical protein